MKSTVISKKLVIVSLILAGLLAATNLFSQEPELLSKVRDNDIEAVKALIAAGADVNQEDDMMGYTPLGLTKNIEICRRKIVS